MAKKAADVYLCTYMWLWYCFGAWTETTHETAATVVIHIISPCNRLWLCDVDRGGISPKGEVVLTMCRPENPRKWNHWLNNCKLMYIRRRTRTGVCHLDNCISLIINHIPPPIPPSSWLCGIIVSRWMKLKLRVIKSVLLKEHGHGPSITPSRLDWSRISADTRAFVC